MQSAEPVQMCILQCSKAYTGTLGSASHTGCKQGRAFQTHMRLSAARHVETALPWHASLRESEHSRRISPALSQEHHTSTQLGHTGQGLGTAHAWHISATHHLRLIWSTEHRFGRAGHAHARHYPGYQAGAGRSPIRLACSCAAPCRARPGPDQAVAHSPVKHTSPPVSPCLFQGGGSGGRGHLHAPKSHAQNSMP